MSFLYLQQKALFILYKWIWNGRGLSIILSAKKHEKGLLIVMASLWMWCIAVNCLTVFFIGKHCVNLSWFTGHPSIIDYNRLFYLYTHLFFCLCVTLTHLYDVYRKLIYVFMSKRRVFCDKAWILDFLPGSKSMKASEEKIVPRNTWYAKTRVKSTIFLCLFNRFLCDIWFRAAQTP